MFDSLTSFSSGASRRICSRVALPGICTLGAVLGLAGTAHAGHWELDHLEENGRFVSQNQTIYDDTNGRHTYIKTYTTVLKWTAQGQKTYVDGVESSYFPNYRTGVMLTRGGGTNPGAGYGDVRTVSGIASGKSEGWYNVRAVMHWVRDNSNDNPPTFAWIEEHGWMIGGEGDTTTGYNYDEQHPFANSLFGISISHPFKVPFNGTIPASTDGWRFGGLDLRDRYATCVPAEGDYAYGPTRRFHVKLTLPASVPGGDITHSVSASTNCTYIARPARLNILARLKGDHTPSDLSTDFDTSATVAVGHKVTDTHEHEADLVLKIEELNGNTWQSVESSHLKGLPGLKLDNKPGIDEHGHFSIFPSDAPALGYTDINGSGRIALGKGLSRDEGTNSINQLVIRPNAGGTNASIAHVWDQSGEWYSGANGDEEFDPYVTYDEATPLTFKPSFGLPITNHKINFLVTKVQVAEWDEGQNTSVTRIYTTNSTEVDAMANPPVLYKANLSDYASFSSAQSGDLGGGVYRSSLIVPFNPEKIVQNLDITTQDDECYEPHDE